MLKSPGALGNMLGMGGGRFQQALAGLQDQAEGLEGLSCWPVPRSGVRRKVALRSRRGPRVRAERRSVGAELRRKAAVGAAE